MLLSEDVHVGSGRYSMGHYENAVVVMSTVWYNQPESHGTRAQVIAACCPGAASESAASIQLHLYRHNDSTPRSPANCNVVMAAMISVVNLNV